MIFLSTVSLSPVCCRVFNVDIYWYGVAYVLSLLCALYYAKRLTTEPTNFDAFIPYACIGIVIGGRLGHVLFFEYHYYSLHLIDIFKIRDGGMSFHGGLCGVITAAWLFCKTRGINLMSFLDILAMTAPIGLFFGRLANFINGELYGVPTTLPWGVYFRGVVEPRHPTQIYEAITEGLLTFCVLRFYNSKLSTGVTAYLFIFCYAISRFTVDFLKDTDRYIHLSVGQWLSISMIAVNVIGYLIWKKKFIFSQQS
jgi:phosphatidylglycerol:prolipoprotein diacylglycerol transferase